jgi:hypothetical protein
VSALPKLDRPHLKYLVVSLRPSSTGVSPTLCFTSQEPFTILGISLKAPLRRSVDSGSSPPATNLPHTHRVCTPMLARMCAIRSPELLPAARVTSTHAQVVHA